VLLGRDFEGFDAKYVLILLTRLEKDSIDMFPSSVKGGTPVSLLLLILLLRLSDESF